MAPADIAEPRTGPPPLPDAGTAAARSRSLVKRHPVVTYFVLVFTLSWGAFALLTGGLGPVGTADPRFLVLALTAPAAPAIVGLLLTGLVAGGAGYRDLLERLLHWRLGVRWYAVALLLAPMSTIAATVVLAFVLRSPEVMSTIFTSQDPVRGLLLGVIAGLVAGLCEEVGWTGFAIPRMRLRHSIIATGVLVGLVWGAWHFPLFREADSFSGALPLALLLVQLFAWLPAYRVVMVWLYDHTRSLLVVVLMHASLIANQLLLQPKDLSDAQALIHVLVWAGLLWLVFAAIAIASRAAARAAPHETVALQ